MHIAVCALLCILGSTTVTQVGGGNALTLPVQRHLVRMDPPDSAPVWLLAIQQDGVNGNGLGLFRSTNEGSSWSYAGPIQDDASEPDRAELLPSGNDLWVLYSPETPAGIDLTGSTRHDVVLQRWAYAGGGHWSLASSVTAFDSTSSSTAYYRATMTVDSQGRLWILAFKLESSGDSSVVVAVSTDGGSTFSRKTLSTGYPNRLGGRIDAVAGKVLVLFDAHDAGTASHYFVRSDSSSTDTWSSANVAWSEGIYHGAAYSSVVIGSTLHIVYKDENETLWYRTFNGSSFSARTLIDSHSDWAMQPAVSDVAGEPVVFWNHQNSANDYEIRFKSLTSGSTTVVDGSSSWKGYLAAPDHLPSSAPQIVCAYGNTPTPNDSGVVSVVRIARNATTPPATTVDAGQTGSPPPTGTDAGQIGSSSSAATSTLLFSDDFNRTDTSGLGPNWVIARGLWLTQSSAQSDLDSDDLARTANAFCTDCRVEARVVGFGVPVTGLAVRESSSALDRYEVVLTSSGALQIRRYRNGAGTILAQGASGLSSLDDFATLSLSVSGSATVSLTAYVNGVGKLQIADSSDARITGSGYAGLHTQNAGVVFDDFKLFVEQSADAGTPGTDAGAPDAGVRDAGTQTPDAGARDAGSPDAGVPDAGSRDAGSVDAGTVDAGVRDGGVADAGTPDAGSSDAGAVDAGTNADAGNALLFSDDFTRANGSLGSNWLAARGLWILQSNAAQSDLDGADLALEQPAQCRDCKVEAQVLGFGVPETALVLRSGSASPWDRYDVNLNASGTLQIRRWRNGSVTVLGSAPSGIADLGSFATISLSAIGAGPVTLSAAVNGTPKLNVTDSSSSAISLSGRAGLSTGNAGVVFDRFRLTGGGSSGTPPPDAGTPDAGTPPPTGGGTLSLSVTFTNSDYRVMAVTASGTILALQNGDSGGRLYASDDSGRSFSLRYSNASADFTVMSVLSNGTLLATMRDSSGWSLWRSIDGAASFTKVLTLGSYQTLTPNSIQELDGTVFLLEYQTFTGSNTPIRLWASTNQGATWSTRFTFSGHRHGHGLRADPLRHELWAYFGDTTPQCGVYRSQDGGLSWTLMLGNQQGDVVDAVVTPNGLLFGQDISFLPDTPHVARINPDGTYVELAPLAGPAYSTFAVPGGGYVIGAAREPGGDIYPSGEVSAHVYVSADGVKWSSVLSYPRLSPDENARADVYFALPDGQLVLELENIQGFPTGFGFQLLRPVR